MKTADKFLPTLRTCLFGLAGASCLCGAVLQASENVSSLPKVKFFVDRVEAMESGGEIRVPANAKTLDIQIGESVWNSQNPNARRFRYKLEGVDREWQNRTGDMGLAVFFYDKAGDLIRKRYFWANNNSPGWDGTLDSAKLVHRIEKLIVPSDGSKLSLVISSAGPPDTYGVYALDELVLQRKKSGKPETVLHAASSALDLKSDEEKHDPWTRDGTHAPMAKRIQLAGSDAQALCVVDDNPLAHAEWHLTKESYPMVNPGEELTLEWNEMYSIGLCDRVSTSYSVPKAGIYKLKVDIVDVMGNSGAESSLRIVVYTPYWMSPWFWLGCAIFLSIPIWLGVRQIIRTRVRNQIHRIEQEQMVERERLRIAREIHDDLGARLTQVSLVSGLAKREAASLEEARDQFQKISNMTRELVSALYETVWTVDPGNDHLDALVGHLIQMIDAMCAPTSMRCRIDAPPIPGDCPVVSSVRHHVSLAVKEALHNAIKYSGGSELSVHFEWNPPFLSIFISDNGRGFSMDHVSTGRGLANMRERMQAVGGTVTIESLENSGTKIIFRIPI